MYRSAGGRACCFAIYVATAINKYSIRCKKYGLTLQTYFASLAIRRSPLVLDLIDKLLLRVAIEKGGVMEGRCRPENLPR